MSYDIKIDSEKGKPRAELEAIIARRRLIAVDAAGNFTHSAHYKGVIRWDFGKQQCTPYKELAIDPRAAGIITRYSNTQGTYTPGLSPECWRIMALPGTGTGVNMSTIAHSNFMELQELHISRDFQKLLPTIPCLCEIL